MQRQAERRARFQLLIPCRPISRRARRDMARQRAKREFRAARHLPEPQR